MSEKIFSIFENFTPRGVKIAKIIAFVVVVWGLWAIFGGGDAEKTCFKGDVGACIKAAKQYEQADGHIRDLKRAKELLEIACVTGEGPACKKVGEYLIEPESNRLQNTFAGLKYFERSCEFGDAGLCEDLGKQAIEYGDRMMKQGAKTDEQKQMTSRLFYRAGVNLIEQSCEYSDAQNCLKIGKKLKEGDYGIANQNGSAIERETFKKACEKDKNYCIKIAEIYAKDLNAAAKKGSVAQDKNLGLAYEFYKKACFDEKSCEQIGMDILQKKYTWMEDKYSQEFFDKIDDYSPDGKPVEKIMKVVEEKKDLSEETLVYAASLLANFESDKEEAQRANDFIERKKLGFKAALEGAYTAICREKVDLQKCEVLADFYEKNKQPERMFFALTHACEGGQAEVCRDILKKSAPGRWENSNSRRMKFGAALDANGSLCDLGELKECAQNYLALAKRYVVRVNKDLRAQLESQAQNRAALKLSEVCEASKALVEDIKAASAADATEEQKVKLPEQKTQLAEKKAICDQLNILKRAKLLK